MAARTECLEAVMAEHVQQRLGHDAARGIAGAQDNARYGIVFIMRSRHAACVFGAQQDDCEPQHASDLADSE